MPQIIPPPGYTLEDEKKITPPPGYTLETVGLTPLPPHKTWDAQPPAAQAGMGKIVPTSPAMRGRFPAQPGGLKSLAGLGAGSLSALSGFAAFPLSTAVSVGLMTPGAGKITLPPAVAEMAGQGAGQGVTYKPKTDAGKNTAEALGAIFKPIEFATNFVAKKLYPKDQDGQALVRTIIYAGMLVVPSLVKGILGKGGKITLDDIADIKKATDIPKDVIEQGGRLQSPPKPTGNPIADAKAQADFSAAQVAREATRPPSPGISVTPPAGPTTGVKVGEIPPIKPANIQPINVNPAKALADALKQAPRLLPQQKSMYRQEAGARLRKAEAAGGPIGGEKGFEAAYAQMKGKMRQVDFQLPDIGAGNRESLFQMIWDDPYLTQGERFSVAGRPETATHASSGLTGMLDYGKFPAKHEIELMNRVFGNEVGDALIGKMSNTEQLVFWATNFANIPRTMMASFDLSAPLRQGIWLIGRPKQFGRAMGSMFKSLMSEDGYNAVIKNISEKPTFSLGRERGLALTELGSILPKAEEPFMGSGILERLGQSALKRWPGVRGKALNLVPGGVRASERAYVGFLNKIRADVFDNMINTQKELGLYTDKQSGITDIFGVNEKLSSDTARYVNISSGRGNLSGLAKDHAALTNAVFFSPRLMSARLALFDPRTYFDIARIPRKVLGGKKYPFTDIEIIGKESVPKVSKFIRHEAIVDAGKFFAFYTTSAALAKFVLGQDVGKDPRSSDFTKIVSGNTSVDLSGGIGSYARTAFQLAQPLFEKLGILDDSYLVSSTSGKKTKMGGGFNEVSAGDVLVRFFSQKENPVVSFFTNVLFQHDETGKPVNVLKEIRERIIPIVSQDFVELYKDDPEAFKMAIMGTLTIFGAGVQTYPLKTEKSFVDQTTKTRQEAFSGKPSGDRVINELNRAGVKAVLGTKKIGGEPVPEQDIQNVLKVAGEGIRLRVLMLMNSPAYSKQSEEKKKELLQRAVNAGWNAYKSKKKLGVK